MIIRAIYRGREHASYLGVDTWHQALDLALRIPDPLLELSLVSDVQDPEKAAVLVGLLELPRLTPVPPDPLTS